MTTPRDADARPPSRVLWGTVLVLSLLWVGLVAGTAVGGRYFVPAGSGLAGPAIALAYGFLGAAAGAVLAGLLAWKAGPFCEAAWVALVLALVCAAIVGWGIVRGLASAHAELTYDRPTDAPWRARS